MIFIFFFLTVFLILRTEYKASQPNHFSRWFLAVLYILLVGLRGQYVGWDTPTYFDHYYMFGEFGCDFVEVGFDWINRLCYHNSLGVGAFFTICSAITILPVAIIFDKMSNKEYALAASLFYCMSFITLCNGMRQGMAAGIFLLLGYNLCFEDSITKKRYLVYVAGIILASLFHASALALIIFPFFKKIRLSKNICTAIYVLSFLFVFYDLSAYIPDISSIVIGSREYSRYENLTFTEGTSWLGFIISSSSYVTIIILMYIDDTYKKRPMLSVFVLAACIIKNMAFGMPIVGRWSMYFTWFIYVLIAKMFNDMSLRKKTGILWLILFSIFFAVTANAFLSSQNKILPYQFIWEDPIKR